MSASSASPTSGVPNPLTPEWLTTTLRQSSMLTTGQVTRVEERANAAFNSAARHLCLTYSPDAPPDMPERLFFKRNIPEAWAVRAGAREVAFYQVAATMADHLPMLATCYGSAYDDERGDSWLLLRDVSATHTPPVTREQLIAGSGIPPDEQLAAVVEALAYLHAAWWEHPALGTGNLLVSEWYRDQACFEASLREFTDNWGAFQQMAGETLSTATRALGDAALAALPYLWQRDLAERMAARRQLTLSHGDCYLSQFLCPLPESPDTATYLIDFQGACGDLPAMDLVFLFATFWTPEQRHEGQREERLMRAYLDALTGHGVTGYSWDDLVRDYRIALAFMFFYPVWDALEGSSRDYWEPKLHCLASAVDDWRCRELFARAMREA
jgi:hypothetical protein